MIRSWKNLFLYLSCLECPSPTVPNLFPNEDEWTIQVYPGCHLWSFQSIPIHSNSDLLIRVGLAGEYESFEHIFKIADLFQDGQAWGLTS